MEWTQHFNQERDWISFSFFFLVDAFCYLLFLETRNSILIILIIIFISDACYCYLNPKY